MSNMKRVDVAEWLRCPNCGHENVELEHWGKYDDYRATVNCPDCGSGGYLD